MSEGALRPLAQSPIPVAWDEWVLKLDQSKEWRRSTLSFPNEIEMEELFKNEGLVGFIRDHPNNPATLRVYEPNAEGGGPVLGAMNFDPRAEGAAGWAHEGAQAALLDTMLGWCNVINECGGPTLNITIRFLRPAPLNSSLRADGHIAGFERSKIFLKGLLVDPEDPSIIYAEADGLWYNAFGKSTPGNSSKLPMMSPNFAETIKGSSSKHPSLKPETEINLVDLPWIKPMCSSGRYERCTDLVSSVASGSVGTAYVTQNKRLRVEYFIAKDFLTAAISTSGECMGPPLNIHGGCIFSLHADAVISYMKLIAASLGVNIRRGSLRELGVNYRKLTPMWLIYALHVRIVHQEKDATSQRWKFSLRSEMINPETSDVHSDANSEFECHSDGIHVLLSTDMNESHKRRFFSAL